MGLENNTPEDWVETTLGEVAEVLMGQSPKGDTCNENGEGKPLLNGPTEFGETSPMPVQFTTDPKKISLPNDLLFCVRGSTTGRMNWSNQEYAIGRGIAAIRHKKGEEYRKYIKGIFDFKLQRLLAEATGSTFPNVSRSQLESIEINLPPLPEQKAIAKVLTAFDDKIELLQSQNKTLETMAQTIFKEWFGKYRIGDELPESWRVGELGDILSNVKNPVKKGMTINDRVYIPIDKMPMKKLGLSAFSPIQEAKSSLILFEPGDILFGAMRSYFHRVNFSKIKGVTRTTAMVLRPKNNKFLGFSLMLMNQTSTVTFASITSKGSTMPYAVWDGTLENMPIILPKEKIIIDYSEKVNFMLNKIQHNINQIQSLTKTRDTLLPKLMSGQVRVNNIKQTANA